MNVNQLFVGAGASRILFPKELFPHEGFIGIHDDPAVRVLLLECAEKVAIVCLELVMLDRDNIEIIKEIIQDETGITNSNIWVHVTHAITTPHAPQTPRGMGGVKIDLLEEEKNALDNKNSLFINAVKDGVMKAVQAARSKIQAAKMGIGTCLCKVNINRDIETPYGFWINYNPEGYSNHTATILRFEDLQGKLIAALISYGIKPCAIDNSEMERNTRLISSDVPGHACTLLEEKLGAPVLFAMSAAADQVPLEQAWYDAVDQNGNIQKIDHGVQNGLEIVNRLGKQMARDIESTICSISCNMDLPEIKIAESKIQWPGKCRSELKPRKKENYIQNNIEMIEIMLIVLGDAALVGLKPELCAVTESELQKKSPFKHTLVLSMVNGGQKYMPDETSYRRITWEAQSSPFMPGAAEAWVHEVIQLLDQLMDNKKNNSKGKEISQSY